MSNETQILALFEEANPVPDDQVMVRADVTPAAYLATLQQRSSAVTQIDERVDERTEPRKPWLIAAAAAALLVVAGVLVILLSQGEGEAPVATEPPVETSIEGYWAGQEADFFFGESKYAIVIDGALSDSGTYETGVRDPDNRIVTITSGEQTVDCTPGDVAILNYDFISSDIVQLSGTPSDDCGLRPLLDIETLEPTDPFDIPAAEDSGAEAPATTEPTATTTPEAASPPPTVDTSDVTIEAQSGDTFIDVLSNNEDLSTVWGIISDLGVADELRFPEGIANPPTKTTYFAPVDGAWDALAESLGVSTDELLADREYMGMLQGFHTLKQFILPDDLLNGEPGEHPVRTGNGFPLSVILDDTGVTGFVDQTATVVQRIEVDRGVLYVLNAVLIPPSE